MSGVFISVCLPVYNGERFIVEQLKSILQQIGDQAEIIITDDCSTDSSVELINMIDDDRISVYKNASNLGLYRTIETTLEKARGDIIFLSDQDDLWLPNRVSTALHHLQFADLFICDATVVDHNKKTLHDSYFRFRNTRHGVIDNFIRFGYLGCCMTMRNKFKGKNLRFPGTGKFVTHDIWLYFVYAISGRVSISEEKLHLYRRHENNDSHGGAKSKFGIITKVQFRIYLLAFLFRHILKVKR